MDSALQLIIDQVQAAAASGTPLRIRGGGSKDFYGQTLQGEVLDVTPLAGITSYEPTELVVTARAGTPLAELEAVLAERGQCLPFEPPHFGPGATVGGMVAAGLSGPARASVGAVRDYVLGVTLLNGKGELLTFGGQVMKNVAGYDVSRLMAGAMGTLGLLTEISLKVLPVAPAEATLKFGMSQSEALAKLNSWGGQPLPLNASCWVDDAGAPTLYLRLRGAVAAVEAACKTLGGERQDNAATAPDWTLCRDQQLPWFLERGEQDLWRLSVPQTAPVLDLPEPPLVEWHGAQRWVRAAAGEAQRLRDAAAAVGGSATLFIADGAHVERAEGRFDPLKPPLDRIHRQLKKEFDPSGIFNRGRLYPDF
ncbi:MULTISPECIES: glycolate oxidase subunit GlcE [unclassified Polaromonas]|uniref:glycolate oxidase subunit GlcE n=1 Tax=unclassified Polaromonas TaxID=2638319 RepID=UPI000BDD99F1|nr:MULTISPECIES: glycolate oxidase subunit GlcE [unclassified Polaromonas]OYY38453.1 MAG: glycolate oxidase subunit GlcE [Polaromonas sp. 35-63-35]OYZ21389.1 MAG: glycolate oxidase subunit GlcE [Polaromonas sp. 16-63-31]OYZ79196.1 MAG: glycolate oxidase subunit GlcE [Polaromonas sp. 24-63-21]OZA50191.1 MAG: glycolate oxidase subunit GlcE [Polaromonas sp. 17-63-33]OZA89314.1 MAG: glycolate oxidase subunit GlcE [Polaromonas sp. 39-63-25]